MEQKAKTLLLQNEWVGFNANMGALYTFFENLPVAADRLDKEKKKEVIAKLAALLQEDLVQIEKEVFESLPSIDNLDVFPNLREDESVKETANLLQESEFRERLTTWESKHPHKSYRLARLIYSLISNPPMSGYILRKSMLINLVTFLEVLIQTVFINDYTIQGFSKTEAIAKSERLMKCGWQEKLNNLKKIGVPASVHSLYRDKILEISILRNLFVHNDGVVDEEYLMRLQKHKKEVVKLGEIFVVSTKRLQQAMDTIFSFGFLLCHYHWKIHEGDWRLQNQNIEHLFLDSLERERYKLILKLSENFKVLEFPDNINQRVLVDRAIAFRESGMTHEVRGIISELKTSNHDWQIDIAISALDNNYKELQFQFTKAKSSHDIRKMAHWPLFNPIKNELWFKRAMLNNKKPKFRS